MATLPQLDPFHYLEDREIRQLFYRTFSKPYSIYPLWDESSIPAKMISYPMRQVLRNMGAGHDDYELLCHEEEESE